MRTLCIILLASAVCSCGALKRTKQIDKVKQSAKVEVKTGAVTKDNSKVKERVDKEEKSSEKRSNEVVEEREVFYNEKGSIVYVKERKTSYSDESKDVDRKESSDIDEDRDVEGRIRSEARSESKVDSLKKETDTVQPENSVFKFIGIGFLLVFAAIALVVFIRFRK